MMKTRWVSFVCLALGGGLVALGLFAMPADSALLLRELLCALGILLFAFGMWSAYQGSRSRDDPAPGAAEGQDLGSFHSIRSYDVPASPMPDEGTGYGQVRPTLNPATGMLSYEGHAAGQTASGAGSAPDDSAEPRTGVFKLLIDESYATAADREELTAALTRHVGALARVMVDRIDSRRLTRNELLMQAAQAIEDDDVRERFMNEMGLYR
jgi:hypothetical protein